MRVLGSGPIAAAARWLTCRRLRVLTYHDVGDPRAFAKQLDLFAGKYVTVTSDDVIAWIDGERPLPERPLWITFDDGDPSVFNVALPLLTERGLSATAFICPGLLNSTTAHWWATVSVAIDQGLAPAGSVSRLKQVTDGERRAEVARLSERLLASGQRIDRAQWSTDNVHAWVAAGNDVGNHTWDHPCLDKCTPEEQARQIREAHDALTAVLGTPPRVFAWPNGNVASESDAVLRDLGYRIVLPCDHRLVARQPDPLSMSRLRIDADAEVFRARAIMSGSHSVGFGAIQRVRRWRGGSGGS